MLSFFLFTSPRSPKSRRMSTLSRFSPPRSDCMREYQNQYIPFFLFCFLAGSSPEESTAHCPMGSPILPLYFPLDQPTAIGVSPATSSYSGSRYYKHYSVQHLHLRGILISTSSFLPGFSPTSSRLNSALPSRPLSALRLSLLASYTRAWTPTACSVGLNSPSQQSSARHIAAAKPSVKSRKVSL